MLQYKKTRDHTITVWRFNNRDETSNSNTCYRVFIEILDLTLLWPTPPTQYSSRRHLSLTPDVIET